MLSKLFHRLFPSRFTKHSISSKQKSCSSLGVLERQPQGSVIMLDIDGVLHPYQSGSFIHLPKFEKWLKHMPEVDVVISSSWRESHALHQLKSFFSDDMQHRIIGTTPILYEKSRLDEIQIFAREHKIRQWVAIDDDLTEFSDKSRLVATKTSEGLTEESYKKLNDFF